MKHMIVSSIEQYEVAKNLPVDSNIRLKQNLWTNTFKNSLN